MSDNLFPENSSFSNPLEERVGKQFFADLPKKPGIYKMYGFANRLLYIGKSKNLRNRLFTYRRANQCNSSRKICRLVRMVYKIEFTICSTEEAALLKENALIRKCKPEFNRAKKSPHSYYYLSLDISDQKFDFNLDMNWPEEISPDLLIYGAFKGHGIVRGGTGALLRQLYLIEHKIDTPFKYPSPLLNKFTPKGYSMTIKEGVICEDSFMQSFSDYLNGRSVQLIKCITEVVEQRALLSKFIGKLILRDLKSMHVFYKYCLQRNRRLIDKLELDETYILQENLDDYLIKAAFKD